MNTQEYLELLEKQQRLRDTIDSIGNGILLKYGTEISAREELIIEDIINEFLIYTNREEVPTNAEGLLRDMAFKRIRQIDNLAKNDSNIKSMSQGNISITYNDSNSQFEMSDSEKKLLNKYKLLKIVKRR